MWCSTCQPIQCKRRLVFHSVGSWVHSGAPCVPIFFIIRYEKSYWIIQLPDDWVSHHGQILLQQKGLPPCNMVEETPTHKQNPSYSNDLPISNRAIGKPKMKAETFCFPFCGSWGALRSSTCSNSSSSFDVENPNWDIHLPNAGIPHRDESSHPWMEQ
jgi:hypothetical protein